MIDTWCFTRHGQFRHVLCVRIIVSERNLILANDSGGLYRFRKALMERLICDGHEVYAVTSFDEYVDELRALGVCFPLNQIRLLRLQAAVTRVGSSI